MKRLLIAGAVGALFFLTTFLAGPAIAQSVTGSLSDAALQNELARLGSYRNPEGKLRGYRDRVRSSNYEVEKQMQQLDKLQMEADHHQYNLILAELSRRDTERHKAKDQAVRDRMEVQRQAMHDTYQQVLDQNKARSQYYDQQTRASEQERNSMMLDLAKRQEQADQQVRDYWQAIREDTPQPVQQSWEVLGLPPELISPQPDYPHNP